MENQTGSPAAIASSRAQVQIHIEDQCPICKKKFLKDDKTLNEPVSKSDDLGLVHNACYFPFHKESNLKVLFQIRCWSIGDTLACTPVIRELRRLYPRIQITVMTFYTDLFKYNPYINQLLDMNQKIPQAIVDQHAFILDGFNSDNKHHFAMHSVEFSSQSAFNKSLIPTEWEYELYYGDDDMESAKQIIQSKGITDQDKLILIHPHKTEWETRDWGAHRMPELARRLKAKYPDHKLVSIGGKRQEAAIREMKNYVQTPVDVELYGELSLLQTAAFLDMPQVKLLVTPDTGTLHLAATRPELPIVGIFTLIKSYFRTPVRSKRFAYKFIGVESESGCNCTYNTRLLTNDTEFQTCPKKTFFDQTLKGNLPVHLKAEGYFNETGNKGDEKIGKLLRDERDKYSDPGNLPCFPSIERVMTACEKLLGMISLK
jgi:ADP-heptose:LPS heptosyltransferase